MKYTKIYIDTNVIRDCIKRRKDYSISLMKLVRDNKIECVTSVFSLLELWRIEKEEEYFYKKVRSGWELNSIISGRRNKDLTDTELNQVNDRLDKFFKEYSFIQKVQLEGAGWQFAVDIARTTNFEPADIMQLATAMGEGCQLVVTGDDPFITEAKKFISQNKHTIEIIETSKAEDLLMKESKQEKVSPPKKMTYQIRLHGQNR